LGECLESRHRLFISSWHRTGGFAIGSRSGSVTVAVQGSGGELANVVAGHLTNRHERIKHAECFMVHGAKKQRCNNLSE
jgi:hypothetical protein